MQTNSNSLLSKQSQAPAKHHNNRDVKYKESLVGKVIDASCDV